MYRRLAIVIGAVALCLPLSGCWKDQQQAAATCSAAYPRPHDTVTHFDLRVKLVGCMNAKGYRFVPAAISCAGEATPGRTPYCYEPVGLFARWGFDIESGIRGPKPPPG